MINKPSGEYAMSWMPGFVPSARPSCHIVSSISKEAFSGLMVPATADVGGVTGTGWVGVGEFTGAGVTVTSEEAVTGRSIVVGVTVCSVAWEHAVNPRSRFNIITNDLVLPVIIKHLSMNRSRCLDTAGIILRNHACFSTPGGIVPVKGLKRLPT